MKHYKTYTEVRETQTLTHTTCDMCKNEIILERFEESNITVEATTGEAYPDGSILTKKSVDLCRKCFEEQLIPWLESSGCEITTEDVGY